MINEVAPTLSPSMDIQVSSNQERLFFQLLGRDGEATRRLMEALRRDGRVTAPTHPVFRAYTISDDETLRRMMQIYNRYGYLVDPHTAVGLGAVAFLQGLEAIGIVPKRTICLSTASPAKFPAAVITATGVNPELPLRLADLYERPEHFVRLPNDYAAVRQYVGTAF